MTVDSGKPWPDGWWTLPGVGLDALCAVLFAAQTAALLLSLAGPLIDRQPPWTVALDLAEAVEEPEWVAPS